VRVVRVRKRVKGEHYSVHIVKDEEETVCRLELDELDIVDEQELAVLPALEGCGSCRRIYDGWKRPTPVKAFEKAGGRVFLEPSLGRVRKVGSLNHGTLRHRGSRLRR
jgi:hypothetical protein